jgi:hypothetical protein
MLPPTGGATYYNQVGGWSWLFYILPFIEGGPSVDRADQNKAPTDTSANQGFPDSNFTIVNNFRMPGLVCPTMRTFAPNSSGWGGFQAYQATDYVPVVHGGGNSGDYYDIGSPAMLTFPAQAASGHRSVAGSTKVRSNTTFGSVTDGLSNTIMIGEKYMDPSYVNSWVESPALVWHYQHWYTGRILGGGHPDSAVAGQPAQYWSGHRRCLARRPTELRGQLTIGDTYPQPYGAPCYMDIWIFGSWHPQIWLGVRGDASVAQIRNTAEIGTLSALAGRNEGTLYSTN